MSAVHFVGAGPGEADLLTVRGTGLLDRADAVAHEPGLSAAVLGRIPATARRVVLGTGGADAGAALVAAVRTGLVVRLVAGDAARSGAVRREAAALRRAGVAFELVPGVGAAEAPGPQPLLGRTVVVTRARAQARELGAPLEALGADVVYFPTIRLAPPADPQPLRDAVRRLDQYDWIIFTSVNGVDRFWAVLDEAGLDARALNGRRVAAIGPATAGALGGRGVRADLVPDRFVAEAVLEALAGEAPLEGARFLLPRAAGARSVLPDGLAARGARVDDIEAYRTVPDAAGAAELRSRLDDGAVDVLTFTASSTVRSFVEAVGPGIGGARVAAIGPITAETARELGVDVQIEADVHTIPGLIDAILRAVSDRPEAPAPVEQVLNH